MTLAGSAPPRDTDVLISLPVGNLEQAPTLIDDVADSGVAPRVGLGTTVRDWGKTNGTR